MSWSLQSLAAVGGVVVLALPALFADLPADEPQVALRFAGEWYGDHPDQKGPITLRPKPIELDVVPPAPTDLQFLPDGNLLVLEKTGLLLLYRLDLAGSTGELIRQIPVPNVHSDEDCGALALVLDPGFVVNRRLLLGSCFGRGDSRILRLTLNADLEAITKTEPVANFSFKSPTYPYHNLGSMGFEGDDTLWALVGDMTSALQPSGKVPSPLGTLVRLNVSQSIAAGSAQPAQGNPTWPDGDESIVYAKGLRSPWRGGLDEHGRYWVTDVGNSIDELNVVTRPGQHFGWPFLEGTCSCVPLTPPLRAWSSRPDNPFIVADDQASGEGRPLASWGGLVWPDGVPGAAALEGYVLYGDFYSGWIRGVHMNADDVLQDDLHLGHLPFVTGWGQDPESGHLLVATMSDPGHLAYYGLEVERPGALWILA